MKLKRVAALCGVAIFVLLLIATMIVACISFPGSQQVFIFLVACDILLPVFIWAYMLLIKVASRADDDMKN